VTKLWFSTLFTPSQSKYYLSLVAKFTHLKSAIKCGSQLVCRYLIIIVIIAREKPLSLFLSLYANNLYIYKEGLRWVVVR